MPEEFRVTFGSQYAREAHPRFSRAHPDGWVTIAAAGAGDARAFAVLMLGTAWCDLYGPESREDWDPSLFPMGELARFVTPLAAGDSLGAPVAEFGVPMTGGGWLLEDASPGAVVPIKARAAVAVAHGWVMHSRRVIVVDDWGPAE